MFGMKVKSTTRLLWYDFFGIHVPYISSIFFIIIIIRFWFSYNWCQWHFNWFFFLTRHSTVIQCERLKSSQRWRSNDIMVLNKCQKPIAVMLNLIEMFLPKSGLVVDVTYGTGTTAVRSCRFLLVRDEIPGVCICILSLVYAASDALSSLSAHGVINCICFTCSRYMCYRNFPFPRSHSFHLGCILIPKYLFHLFGEQARHYSSK